MFPCVASHTKNETFKGTKDFQMRFQEKPFLERISCGGNFPSKNFK